MGIKKYLPQFFNYVNSTFGIKTKHDILVDTGEANDTIRMGETGNYSILNFTHANSKASLDAAGHSGLTSVNNNFFVYPNAFRHGAGGNWLPFSISLPIGDWDMDTDSGKSVAHGLNLTTSMISEIIVMIRNDANTQWTPLSLRDSGLGDLHAGYFYADATNVICQRDAAGIFNGVDYNATSYNRGIITVKYFAVAVFNVLPNSEQV